MIFTVEGIERIIPEELLAPFTEDAVQAILVVVMDSTRDFWVSEAQAELHTTQVDYVNGLQPVEYAPGQASITLLGALPNIVERGMDEVDLRTTLLGPNVPIAEPGERGKHLTIRPSGETGYYRAIPFRHGTPGTKGGAGRPMPEEVYEEAKKLRAQISDPYKGTDWEKGKGPKRLQEGLAPKLAEHHKTDIYAGMIREQETYEKATQGQYVTFRTISTLVEDGWIRPATPGKNFAERALDYAEKSMTEALEAFIEG